MNNEKNKVFAIAMFALFAIVMITSNYSMAKSKESGSGGDSSSGGDSGGGDNGGDNSSGDSGDKESNDKESNDKGSKNNNNGGGDRDGGESKKHKGVGNDIGIRNSNGDQDLNGDNSADNNDSPTFTTIPGERTHHCNKSDCEGPGLRKGPHDDGNGNGKGGDGDSYDGGHNGNDDRGHDGNHNGDNHNHNDNKNKHHSHGSHNHNHNHGHNYDNDKHYHNHDDNNYYYYYSNDYSSNHATVILQLDYHGSSNHDNIRLEIGNDFDTTINFAGEPEDLVVTGLDLDDGEDFSVCLENEDSGKVNCVDTSIRDQDEALYVDIRVPA